MTQKTKIEIIDETVEFYSNNPRALSNTGTCQYLTSEGLKCAFARCCTDESVTLLHEKFEGKVVAEFPATHGESIPDVETLLKDEYKGHGNLFWGDVQMLHDFNRIWDSLNGGLSNEGLRKVNELKAKYS